MSYAKKIRASEKPPPPDLRSQPRRFSAMMKIHDLLAAERFPNCSRSPRSSRSRRRPSSATSTSCATRWSSPSTTTRSATAFTTPNPSGVPDGEGHPRRNRRPPRRAESPRAIRGHRVREALRNAFEKLTASLDSEASVSWEDLSRLFLSSPQAPRRSR